MIGPLFVGLILANGIWAQNCRPEDTAFITGCLQPMIDLSQALSQRNPRINVLTYPLFYFPPRDILNICETWLELNRHCLTPDLKAICPRHGLYDILEPLFGFSCDEQSGHRFFGQYECLHHVISSMESCTEFIRAPSDPNARRNRCGKMPNYFACVKNAVERQCGIEALDVFTQTIQYYGCHLTNTEPDGVANVVPVPTPQVFDPTIIGPVSPTIIGPVSTTPVQPRPTTTTEKLATAPETTQTETPTTAQPTTPNEPSPSNLPTTSQTQPGLTEEQPGNAEAQPQTPAEPRPTANEAEPLLETVPEPTPILPEPTVGSTRRQTTQETMQKEDTVETQPATAETVPETAQTQPQTARTRPAATITLIDRTTPRAEPTVSASTANQRSTTSATANQSPATTKATNQSHTTTMTVNQSPTTGQQHTANGSMVTQPALRTEAVLTSVEEILTAVTALDDKSLEKLEREINRLGNKTMEMVKNMEEAAAIRNLTTAAQSTTTTTTKITTPTTRMTTPTTASRSTTTITHARPTVTTTKFLENPQTSIPTRGFPNRTTTTEPDLSENEVVREIVATQQRREPEPPTDECTPELRKQSHACLAPLMDLWTNNTVNNPVLNELILGILIMHREQVLNLCDHYASAFLDCELDTFYACRDDSIVHFADGQFGYACGNAPVFFRKFDCLSVLSRDSVKCRKHLKLDARKPHAEQCSDLTDFYNCIKSEIEILCSGHTIDVLQEAITYYGCSEFGKSLV